MNILMICVNIVWIICICWGWCVGGYEVSVMLGIVCYEFDCYYVLSGGDGGWDLGFIELI